MRDQNVNMFSRKYTDELYNRFNEPGFDWMGEEGFYKAVHIIAKDIAEAGVEASDCFLAEVGRNEVLKKQVAEAVALLEFHCKDCEQGIKRVATNKELLEYCDNCDTKALVARYKESSQ